MRVFKKEAWDNIIYNLWYPGFLGSMIYDLLPSEFSWKYITSFSPDLYILFAIKVLIVLFFIVDYFHLYNDVHKVVSVINRKPAYFICDIASSTFFLLSFFTVDNSFFKNLPTFLISSYCLVIVTICIGFYKCNCKKDRQFFIFYNLSFIIFYTLGLFKQWQINPSIIFFILVLLQFSVYCFYVYYYYNKNSFIYYFKNRIIAFDKETDVLSLINLKAKTVLKQLNASEFKIQEPYYKAKREENLKPNKYHDDVELVSQVNFFVPYMQGEKKVIKQRTEEIKIKWISLEDMKIKSE